jgi:hypothetical protein
MVPKLDVPPLEPGLPAPTFAATAVPPAPPAPTVTVSGEKEESTKTTPKNILPAPPPPPPPLPILKEALCKIPAAEPPPPPPRQITNKVSGLSAGALEVKVLELVNTFVLRKPFRIGNTVCPIIFPSY